MWLNVYFSMIIVFSDIYCFTDFFLISMYEIMVDHRYMEVEFTNRYIDRRIDGWIDEWVDVCSSR